MVEEAFAVLQGSPDTKLLLFEGPLRSRAICSGFCETLGHACPIPSKPLQHSVDALAVTTASLDSVHVAEWEMASTVQLESSEDVFHLLSALLLKAMQDGNMSEATTWNTDTLAEPGDLLAWCEAVFLEGFVKLSGAALAEGNRANFVRAKACLNAGAQYAIVETGLPFCLDHDNGWSKRETGNFRQMIGGIVGAPYRYFEVLGICFPDVCHTFATSLAWQYLFEYLVEHWNCAALPPVPPSARVRILISNADDLDRLLGPTAPEQFSLWKDEHPDYIKVME